MFFYKKNVERKKTNFLSKKVSKNRIVFLSLLRKKNFEKSHTYYL